MTLTKVAPLAKPKEPWEMTRVEYRQSREIPAKSMTDEQVGDFMRAIDIFDRPRNQATITGLNKYTKELRSKGIEYIDAYHVTGANAKTILKEGIRGSGIDYIGKTGSGRDRPNSVYMFLDPDDIYNGFPGIIGTKSSGAKVVHIRIPIEEVKNLHSDSNFSLSFEAYSSIRKDGNIPVSWIKLIKDYDVSSLKDYDAGIRRNSGYYHKIKIEQALSEGKPVPPEVLADYPDLAAKYTKPVASPANDN